MRSVIKQLIWSSLWITVILLISKILDVDNLEWFMVFIPIILTTLIVSLYNFQHNKKFKRKK